VTGSKKKNGDFSKLVVIAIIVLNVLFTGAVLAVFWHTGAEPGALVAAWFAFTTGELWSLSKIKRSKIEKEKTE